MGKPRILVVEDAADVARLLQRGLSEEGFDVEVAPTGEVALRRLDENWGLIVLDLTLPDLTGEEIMACLAQRADRPPVLVLTAKSQLENKLQLFDLGCDDYLTKPFAFAELLGRVKALLRRPPKAVPQECAYEDMRLNPETFVLTVGEQALSLTPKEFNICRLLMSEAGKIVSKKELLHIVWGLSHEPRTNFIDVHLANLRKKLSQLDRDSWLQTVRASGFLFGRPAANGPEI